MVTFIHKGIFASATVTLFLVIFSLFLGSSPVKAVSIHNVSQFAAGTCNNSVKGIGSSAGKFVFVPWYKYLNCTDGSPDTSGMKIGEVVTKVAVAIIELLTRLAGLVAVGFVLYGSIQYITSQGEPEGLNSAKSTIINALIGFVLVVFAVSIIQFLGRAIG